MNEYYYRKRATELFIKANMQFYSYPDFYDNCYKIKLAYQELDDIERQIYKWYFYSRRNINITMLNFCWDFLNDVIGKEDLPYPVRNPEYLNYNT